jgi:hypothetical protein
VRLPDGVRRLVQAAMDAQEPTAFTVNHVRNAAGDPLVTFTAVRGGHTEVRMTWHTRDAGTYRLSSALARTPEHDWRPVTLRAAIDIITGNTREAQ